MLLSLVLAAAIAAPLARAAEPFEARFAAAVARAQSGDHAAAIAQFEALARDFPQRPEPLNNLAVELAARGDLDRARDALERALRTQPAYATAHDNLRAVYAELAGDAYRKALPVEAGRASKPTLALIAKVEAEPAIVASAPEPGVVVATSAAAPAPTPSAAAPRTAAPAAPAAPAPRVAVPAARDPLAGLAYEAFAAVDAWARAWAAKDVAGYLAAYGSAFVPPDGLSRAAWEAQRSERIRAPKQISVQLAQRDLAFAGDGARATMRFVQTYRSDRFNGSAWKTLELAREQGRWRIVGEKAGR